MFMHLFVLVKGLQKHMNHEIQSCDDFQILIYAQCVNQNDYSIYPDDILHNDYVTRYMV